jgi:hypothetical protein
MFVIHHGLLILLPLIAASPLLRGTKDIVLYTI